MSAPLDLHGSYKLSRFTVIHPTDGGFILESPFNAQAVKLDNSEIFKILLVLVNGLNLSQLLDPLKREARALVIKILEKCNRMELLVPMDDSGETSSEVNRLKTWEFHDLLFHARSRRGRHTGPSGGTWRFGEDAVPTAPRRPDYDVLLPLYRPDISALTHQDKSFTRVLEERVSVRHWSSEPMNVRQLGEFLYRAARVEERPLEGTDQSIKRPIYPSAGGRYPLEIYLTIDQCEGLERGVYHYNPEEHRLERVCLWNDNVDRLMHDACISTATDQYPPVLISLTARFEKTAVKYASIAYALILKDVGCLFQTFYLVATAMGLGACAIGSGNSDDFTAVLDSNYYQETSVGELMLGPKA